MAPSSEDGPDAAMHHPPPDRLEDLARVLPTPGVLLQGLGDLLRRQGAVAVHQEKPEDGVRQRGLGGDEIGPAATVSEQGMPQPVDPPDLRRLRVHIVDLGLLGVSQEALAVLRAQMAHQIGSEILALPLPPLVIDVEGGVQGGLDQPLQAGGPVRTHPHPSTHRQ
ncbi:MAG: hypothetical protein C4312_06445 [Thermoflexus sp.]